MTWAGWLSILCITVCVIVLGFGAPLQGDDE